MSSLPEGSEQSAGITVKISDMRISTSPGDMLITHSLGSCIGLTLYDPEKKIGGLLHALLPLSRMSPEKAANNPAMFVDTGVVALIDALVEAGADKSRLVARVAGAAKLLNEHNSFNIGSRNHTVLRKILFKNKILISAEDVGGSIARTMTLNIATGETMLRSSSKSWVLE